MGTGLIEYKTVGVTGVQDTSIQDGPGVVTAIVSVTGIKDNVDDVIEPGAYADSLTEITPKGAWHHDWTTPVSKTLMSKELMPGDAMLPAKMPNGQPWPKEAGALLIKMQFNLDTQRGREAHSDVLFFGDQQEWSIGYKVPEGGARYIKDAVGGQTRYISKLRCYEYSPVLFGAMPAARTASVKNAQLSFKSLMGQDLDQFLVQLNELERAAFDSARGGIESKNAVHGYSSSYTNRMSETDDEEDEDEDYELDDEEVKAALMDSGITAGELRQSIGVMTKILDIMEAGGETKDGQSAVALATDVDSAMVELAALDYDTTADAMSTIPGLSPDQRVSLANLADQFDRDPADAEAQEALLDALEEEMDSTEAGNENTYHGLQVLARVAGDRAELAEGEKSSRIFGPEYKGLAGANSGQRREMYLTELKSQRPEVFEALMGRYDFPTGKDTIEVKSAAPTTGAPVTISLKELEELSELISRS